MTRLVFVSVVLAALSTSALHAHRLDELLQAARFGIETDRVELELDLTPGISIARGIFDQIDVNRDEVLSPAEELSYARTVIGSLQLDVDGRPQTLELTGQRFPTLAQMSEGVGAIRLTAVANTSGSFGWNHQLRFRNAHRPDVSVYLANALAPTSTSVRIGSQQRDWQQREIRIDYETGAAGRYVWPAALATLLAAAIAARVYPRRQKPHMQAL